MIVEMNSSSAGATTSNIFPMRSRLLSAMSVQLPLLVEPGDEIRLPTLYDLGCPLVHGEYLCGQREHCTPVGTCEVVRLLLQEVVVLRLAVLSSVEQNEVA